jgi:hypothetical protein
LDARESEKCGTQMTELFQVFFTKSRKDTGDWPKEEIYLRGGILFVFKIGDIYFRMSVL